MKTKLFTILLLLSSVSVLHGQDINQHKFFDKTNILMHSFSLTASTLDAISTQRNRNWNPSEKWYLEHGAFVAVPGVYRETNPLARPFVSRGWGGQVAYSYGINFGGTLLASWLAHKTGHHRVERLIPLLQGETMWMAVSNLRQKNLNKGLPPVY